MVSEERKQLLHERLMNAFSPTYLEVIDESYKHKGHKGYQGGGRHFAIIIESERFKSLSRVDAHRLIYELFKDMIPDSIHALRIVVK